VKMKRRLSRSHRYKFSDVTSTLGSGGVGLESGCFSASHLELERAGAG